MITLNNRTHEMAAVQKKHTSLRCIREMRKKTHAATHHAFSVSRVTMRILNNIKYIRTTRIPFHNE